jgi:hypothetical protein
MSKYDKYVSKLHKKYNSTIQNQIKNQKLVFWVKDPAEKDYEMPFRQRSPIFGRDDVWIPLNMSTNFQPEIRFFVPSGGRQSSTSGPFLRKIQIRPKNLKKKQGNRAVCADHLSLFSHPYISNRLTSRGHQSSKNPIQNQPKQLLRKHPQHPQK